MGCHLRPNLEEKRPSTGKPLGTKGVGRLSTICFKSVRGLTEIEQERNAKTKIMRDENHTPLIRAF